VKPRCVYCGVFLAAHNANGKACAGHADLLRLDPVYVVRVHERLQAAQRG